jgi:hypothetical protein
MRAITVRLEQSAVMTGEIGAGQLGAAEDRAERCRERAIFSHQRQQTQSGQRRIGGNMREPRGDDRLGRFALDQRRAKRRIGMSPADQDRQLYAIAARRDARREKTEKLARQRSRPDQHGADVAAKHGRGRKREGWLIKDVGL